MHQRIGVIGGTFDPIHNGHLEVADAVIDSFAIDRMLFVPAYVPPHKRGKEISSQYHRLAMLALATADKPRMFVSTIELESPSQPYTIETLGKLQQFFPESRLFFVMGADSFEDVRMWRDYEKILSAYDVIVAARPGYFESDRGQKPGAHLDSELSARVIDLQEVRKTSGIETVNVPDEPSIYLTDFVKVDVSATLVRDFAAESRPIDQFVPASVAAYIRKYELYQNR